MQQDQTVTSANEREGPGEGAFKKKGTQYNVQHEEAFGNHQDMLIPEGQQDISKAIRDTR